MNIKAKYLVSAILILCLALPTANAAYSVSLEMDNSPNKYAVTGFHINLTSNASENVANINAIPIIRGNSIFKEYCKYEDVNECILYRTDAHGQIYGDIWIGDLFVNGMNYDFQVYVQNNTNASVSTTITITGIKAADWGWDFQQWVMDNAGIILMVVITGTFIGLGILWITGVLHR